MSNPIQKRAWTWLEHIPSLFMAFAGIIIFVIFMFSSKDLEVTSLARVFPHWFQYTWLILCGIASVSILYGVFARWPKFESAGLILIGTMFIIDFYAIVDDRGKPGILSGTICLAAGLYIIFHAVVLIPKHDFSEQPQEVISLADWEKKRGDELTHSRNRSTGQDSDPEARFRA